MLIVNVRYRFVTDLCIIVAWGMYQVLLVHGFGSLTQLANMQQIETMPWHFLLPKRFILLLKSMISYYMRQMQSPRLCSTA